MDEKRLAELEQLAAAATEGPWVPKHIKVAYTNGEMEHWVKSTQNGLVVAQIRFRPAGLGGDDQPDNDLSFIAAARTVVPELVAEVRRCWAMCSCRHPESEHGGECNRVVECGCCGFTSLLAPD